MMIVATLSITPADDGNFTDEIAAAIGALDDHDVSYEVDPMGTTIEAEALSDLLGAVEAAHEAVSADRVRTVLQIDDDRERAQDGAQWVAAVEEALGREPTGEPQA